MVRAKNAVIAIALLISFTVLAPENLFAQGCRPKSKTKIVEISDSFQAGPTKIQVRRFEIPGVRKQPAVLILHGCDGWGHIDAYRYLARNLVERGYVVVLIRYFDRTGTPDQASPDQRAEFRRWLEGNAAEEKVNAARLHFDMWMETIVGAVAYIRALSNVDLNRVGMVGCSLGGFLAVSAAANGNLAVKAVVELFAGVPEEKRKSLRTLPPTLILHGEEDDVVSVKEAHALHGLLLQRKQTVEAEIFPKVGHAFIPPGKDEPDFLTVMKAMSCMERFLSKYLQPMAMQAASK
jgi:carboxymethylenebutenolidase